MKHDLYVSFLFQICFPSRIKMGIDAEYEPIKKKRIAIVSCKSRKQDYVCSANEMYSPSHLYKAQREFFIKGYDDYYIISSKYGIIHHSQIIEPYDITLGAHSNNMTKNQNIECWSVEKLEFINKQLEWMINKEWKIDFHVSKVYYSPLSNDIKTKVNYIKQPRGVNNVKPIYEAATTLLDNKSLDECLKFISEKKVAKYHESSKWFYHPNYEPFFGKSLELATIYSEYLNKGGIYRVSVGIFTHHRGWVIDESLLDKLYQTDSGQWRIKE